ncbi:MAG: Gfo/Idh/MocA family oxidoreductase [Verrucomicrobia bacterium]|nr:Gfo/Idh/MocA family oxidoreductase [Verrucomicrobiota bacterium]
MNRRSFFKLISTAAPAAVMFPQIVKASTLGLGGGIAPSNRINFGLIGAGNQGNHVMYGFRYINGVQFVAICDVDRGRRDTTKASLEGFYASRSGQDKYLGCESYLDYGELLARPDIDAVLVATPDHWHALPVVDAARAGKHIYCEKPVANSIIECRAMVAAVERAGVVCQLGNMQRSSGEFRRAMSLVRGGYLGKITRVQVGLPGGGLYQNLKPSPVPAASDFDYGRWLGPAPYRPYCALKENAKMHYNWRWCYDFGGGQLSDWICHHHDIAVLGLGLEGVEVSEIREAKGTFPDLPVELRATATKYSFEAVYANGTVISVSSSFGGGVRYEGTEGWIAVDRGRISYSNDRLKRLVIPSTQQIFGPSTVGHYENMIECIRTGARPRSPIDEVSRVTTVAHLANAAIRSGRETVVWNAAAGEIVGAPEAQRFLTRTYRAPYVLQS